MGVDTYGKLRGKVEIEEVANFISQKFEVEVTFKSRTENYGYQREHKKPWLSTTGWIDFKYKDENRSVFYIYCNINHKENLEYYAKHGLRDMVETHTTHVGLGYWGNSVEIIKAIVTEFGGWIDENDCDEEEYYPIEKDSDGDIKPVIRVTRKEINEKFGAVVIIEE